MTTGEVRAGIVVTGTELLTGVIADRNGLWLAGRLGELGVEVAHLLVVGDRSEDLSSALRFLADQGVDLIVTSGGLGSTADDLTVEVVARFDGVDLVPDVDPVRTAPGLVVPGFPVVIALPGPPRELQSAWQAALATAPVREVLDRTRPYEAVRLRLFGLLESEIAKTLHENDVSGLEITTCLRASELEVDIRHRPQARAAREALVSEIARRHGSHLFSVDGSTVDDQVAALLAGRWIGVAESCTGGMLAGRLTARAGSSVYVAGAVVSYSNQAKTTLLGVQAELIERHGAVSPEVARAMADGALRWFTADVGVGITGVAGPGGGTAATPVGYVCLCAVTADGAVLARDPVLPGDRGDVRECAVSLAMHMLRRLLGG